MESIWQWSVALIAVAFTGLVVYSIRTLRAAEKSMDKVSHTLTDVQRNVDDLTHELKQVLKQAQGISEDVQYKMGQIDPMLNSVKNVGETLSEVSLAAKQASTTLVELLRTRTITKSDDEVDNSFSSAPKGSWTKWVDIAASLWQKYRH